MSFLRRLVERRDLMSSSFTDPNRIPRNSEGYSVFTGRSVTPDTALRLAAVHACVRLLSQTVASLPVDVYRRAGKARLLLDLPPWLERPNPDFNRFEFLEQVMCSLLLHGNAYLAKVVDLDSGELSELWVINPDDVRIEDREGRRRVYVVHRNGRLVGEYDPDDIVHVRAFSAPGCIYGFSPIDLARQSIGLGLATEEYGARFFSNGANPSGVIEFPGGPDDPVLKRMAKSWKLAHQGLAHAHEPGFLTGGATWKPITIPNDNAQFIETRNHQIAEIARWFLVPPHKIGHLERATFSNIEHQAIEFVTDCVLPWLVRLEMALDPLLGMRMAPDRRTRAFLKFNIDGLLRGDSAARAAYYNTMRNIGVLNADEIRALEDEAPIPGGLGQIYWQPSNVMPAGTEPAPTPDPLAALASSNGVSNGN